MAGEVAESEQGGTEGGGQFERSEVRQQNHRPYHGTEQEDDAREPHHPCLQGQAADSTAICQSVHARNGETQGDTHSDKIWQRLPQ